MARIRASNVEASAEELEAIGTITDTAFWQLMLVDELEHATGLVELLVDALRARVDEIVSCAGLAFDEAGELVEAVR